MKQPPLQIKKITQLDNYTFGILWNDGTEQKYRLSGVQKKCPCAQCNVEGAKLVVDDNVRAANISSVGRYAMKIQFTSGCTKGIYTFPLLRDMEAAS